jgi:hypothetical protein
LKRVAAVNRFVEEQNGERVMVESLASQVRVHPQLVFQERQQLRTGYGQYAALRGIAYLGRGSLPRIADDYQRGRSWSEISANNGIRVSDLTGWFGELIRTTNDVIRQLKSQQLRPSTGLQR